MSTLAHSATRPALRPLDRRARAAAVVTIRPPAAAPATFSDRLDHWLGTLPEPRNRLGAATRV